jgi:hypothetical protein
VDPRSVVAREKGALEEHRAALRASVMPARAGATRGTFVHGLVLPLTLLAATLRSPDLRRPFLRLAAVRCALLAVVAIFALRKAGAADQERPPGVHVVSSPGASGSAAPVQIDVPGLHVHLEGDAGAGQVEVLGRTIPVTREDDDDEPLPAPEPAPTTWLGRARRASARGWARVVAFVGVLSVAEAVIVFFSRRWDDWLSFYVSGLAGIRPEIDVPPHRRLAFDLRWLYRKLRRRARGYVVFASGLPLLYLLELVPWVGHWLFAAGAALWAWYWVGVFTASKSAHAWADDGVADAPFVVRTFNEGVARGWWFWPARVYGRIWGWLVRGVSPAAATFDRTPAAFLGLALARAVLALPGLYLLARPLVPVAAGRLCAEGDARERFWARPPAA